MAVVQAVIVSVIHVRQFFQMLALADIKPHTAIVRGLATVSCPPA